LSKYNELSVKYPNLYALAHKADQGRERYPFPMFGFECGPGWYNIIDELSEKLEALILKLPKKNREHVCATQVKEKYGTLRFYMAAATDEMEELIIDAVKKSAVTCEVCGEKGKLRGESWYYTACDEHANSGD
jgi:hypothetical protein